MMRSGKLLVKRPVTPMRLAACEVFMLLAMLENQHMKQETRSNILF